MMTIYHDRCLRFLVQAESRGATSVNVLDVSTTSLQHEPNPKYRKTNLGVMMSVMLVGRCVRMPGFFSKVYYFCWESSPLDGDFLIFTLFGFLFWTRYILSSSFFPLSFLKTFIRLKTCLPWKIKEFKNCKKTTCNLTLKDSS